MVKTRKAKAPPQRRLNQEQEVKQFFKVIMLSTIQRKMLRIPAKFVRFGPKLMNTVTLETPLGFKRSIKIKRIGEEIWLENGWSEFAESHCISEGYLLLFKYLGNSSFRVVIFNKSASEIQYKHDEINITDDDDDENDGDDDDDDDDYDDGDGDGDNDDDADDGDDDVDDVFDVDDDDDDDGDGDGDGDDDVVDVDDDEEGFVESESCNEFREVIELD